MALIDDALTFNANRGNMDWTNLTPAAQAQNLFKAQDYILANYRLRAAVTADDTLRLNTATFLLAREIANNGSPALHLAQQTKQTKEVIGPLTEETIFFDLPGDPYPQITTLLAPLTVTSVLPNYQVGRLVRGVCEAQSANDTSELDFSSADNSCSILFF